jgi:hypothetical protein
LKTADLYDPWVSSSPLHYRSGNAPAKGDVLGTMFLSVLAGHWRYAHMTAIRSDGVNPSLLGMKQVASEDSVRRAFQLTPELEATTWLQQHLSRCSEALFVEPWILDVDTSVKPLYGKQEGAEVGFNAKKPGRPSHVYHGYLMANTRLVLDVDVQSGKKVHSLYSLPGLWALLDRLPRSLWPFLIRGDCAWGTERVFQEAEARKIDYLFKLRQTAHVRRLVEQLFAREDWESAGQGWQALSADLKLGGWSKRRRVLVLRRQVKLDLCVTESENKQLDLGFLNLKATQKKYEYAVLVTSRQDEDLYELAQHYRDRADIENSFDELKNQWGWAGYTTHDLKRCRIMARTVALIYNWWSLFARLAIPQKRKEAITSRPLLLEAIAKETYHAGQKHLTITSLHGKAETVKRALSRVVACLKKLEAIS